MNKITQIFNFLLNFIYPKKCMICKSIFDFNDKDNGLCEKCYHIFKNLSGDVCIKCGRPLSNLNAMYNSKHCTLCNDFLKGKFSDDTTFYYTKNYPMFVYNEATKKPILDLKYRKQLQNLDGIKKILRNNLQKIELSAIDLVVPIPMHKKKVKKRGFNQATLIANIVSELINKPLKSDIIIRNKFTTVQSDKSPKDRYKNLENCFTCVNQNEILGKTILLVDDIFTSGSTVNVTAKELINNGAKEVFSLTLSIASNNENV